MRAGVILIAHGSRREEANREILALSRLVQEADCSRRYKVAFLQFACPDLPEVAAELAAQGFKHIIVVPLFLFTGSHVTEDIPAELKLIKTRYPDMEFIVARHFAAHPALAQIVLERVQEAVLPGSGAKT